MARPKPALSAGFLYLDSTVYEVQTGTEYRFKAGDALGPVRRLTEQATPISRGAKASETVSRLSKFVKNVPLSSSIQSILSGNLDR
jgi:hypothetical protein